MTNQGQGGPPNFSPEYSLVSTSFFELSEQGVDDEDPSISSWSGDCYFTRQASTPALGDSWPEFLGHRSPQVLADDPAIESLGEAPSHSSLLTTPLAESLPAFTGQANSYNWNAAAAAIEPISAPIATSAISLRKKRCMAVSRPRGNRCPCPIFEAEVERKLPHTCNGGGGNNMSELRTHMTRGGKGRPPHLSFLKLCKVCNNDFIDEAVFHEKHGQNCHFPHPQRKGDAADEYYQAFKAMILAYVDKETKTSTQDYIRFDRNGMQDQNEILRARELCAEAYDDEPRTLLYLDLKEPRTGPYEIPGPENAATPKQHVCEQEAFHQPAFQTEQDMEDSLWFRLDDDWGASEKGIATEMEPHSTWEDTPVAYRMSSPPWNPLDLRGPGMQMHLTVPGPSRPVCAYPSTCSSSHRSSNMSDSIGTMWPRLMPSSLAQISSYQEDSVASLLRNESPENGDIPPNEKSVLFSVGPEVLFCPVVGCTKEFRGKCRRGTRSRHIRLKHMHGREETEYHCEVPACSKVYLRQDARLKHYRKRHGDVINVPAAQQRRSRE